MGKVTIDIKNGNKSVHLVWEGWNLTSEDNQEEILEVMYAIGLKDAAWVLAHRNGKGYLRKLLKHI